MITPVTVSVFGALGAIALSPLYLSSAEFNAPPQQHKQKERLKLVKANLDSTVRPESHKRASLQVLNNPATQPNNHLRTESENKVRVRREVTQSPPTKEKVELKPISPQEYLSSFYSSTTIHDKTNPLTIVVKYDNYYFKIVQWDSDCMCFKQLSKDLGLWNNDSGSFVILRKNWTSLRIRETQEREQCKAWTTFWWQEWDVFNKFVNWINLPKEQIGKNKEIKSNCYTSPVILLDSETELAYFPDLANLSLETRLANSRELYWSPTLTRFVDKSHLKNNTNLIKINNYSDYLKILGLKAFKESDLSEPRGNNTSMNHQ